MAGQPGVQYHAIRELFRIGPPVVERLALEPKPTAGTVSSYVITRGAEHALAGLNDSAAAGRGAIYWIQGPPAVGKTHFLNYLLAIESRGTAASDPRGRRMTVALETAGRIYSSGLEGYLLEAIAARLASEDNRAAMMWRQLNGEAALNVALEEVRRIGFVALTVAIDFGLTDTTDLTEYIDTIARVARNSRQVRMTALIGSRNPPPAGIPTLSVAPADHAELIRVASNRARIPSEITPELAARFYTDTEIARFDPVDIFPFHPRAIDLVEALSAQSAKIPTIAVLLREVLITLTDPRANFRDGLIYPADLVRSPGVMRRLNKALGDAGAAAYRMALAAAAGLTGNELELAEQIVNTLALEHAGGNSQPCSVAEVMRLCPMLAGSRGGWTSALVAEILQKLSTRSSGAIAIDRGGARFNPASASAPEIAAFNSALDLVRKFAPALEPARDRGELASRMKQLRDAMAAAVENCARTESILRGELRSAGADLSPESQKILREYRAAAESAADHLIAAALDPVRREAIGASASAYERLERAAAMSAEMREMREYVEATGLSIPREIDEAIDPRAAKLNSDFQLLWAQLAPRVVAAPGSNLDALRARFNQIKWAYVQAYASAHKAWREESERNHQALRDLRAYTDALGLLNTIAALGPTEGAHLAPAVAQLQTRVNRCDVAESIDVEVSPRCAQCGYTLGEVSPAREIEEMRANLQRAISAKLTILAQSAISRIIREHDQGGRLDGFLKIVQAAQVDALVRVLTQDLASYLARLLDENLGSAGRARGVVQGLDEARFKAAPKLRAAKNGNSAKQTH
jgi:hypothetical protein